MRPLFALAAAGLSLVPAAAQTTAKPKRPHVVVIVSDDAGYADFGVHGSKQMQTPRIDSIAENGIRFTNGYVSGAVCSPSRAGLMTGRYQQRFGHGLNIPPKFSEENGLPLTETTMADEMRAAGYRTCALGKWHLGYADKFHPLSRGFDAYWGFLQGARSYCPLKKSTRLNRLLRDRQPIPETFDYMTDELGRQAANYIEQHAPKQHEQPLMMYLAFNAVHSPMHALQKDLEGLPGGRKRQKLIAMTHALDRAVGYVLDALREAGMHDDTLLVFVNDNGGATNNASQNGRLRGRKGQVWEGGIRVPFLMQWPNGLPKGKVFEPAAIALDFLPTFLAAAGAERSGKLALDGVNLLPFLRGEQDTPPHDVLFWRHKDNWAVRAANWKLVHQGDTTMLIDLARDIGEQDNRIQDHPERVTEMRQRYEAWAAELTDPLWSYGKRKKNGK